MIQADVDDIGNLYFTFKEVDNKDAVIAYKLLNAGELEFLDDDCIGLELLDFASQLNRGKINDIELLDTQLKDDTFVFHIVVNGQAVNGRVNFSSLKDKV